MEKEAAHINYKEYEWGRRVEVTEKKADTPSSLEDTERQASGPEEEISRKHLKIAGL